LHFYAFCYIINLLDIKGIVNMETKQDLENKVFMAARDQGVSSVLFRNAIAQRLGLNATDSECLSYLGIKGMSTPTALAKYTGLTSGSTTAMLDRLEKSGLVRRLPNPSDRRGVLVELAPQYHKAAMPLVAGIQQAHRELLAMYSDKELIVIADFLTRFTKNVTDHTKIIEDKFDNNTTNI
jgi:DNA-binding MarR family transcriptional regulator